MALSPALMDLIAGWYDWVSTTKYRSIGKARDCTQ